MLLRLRLWLWERRLAHARIARSGLEAEFAREIKRAQHDLEHCETMAAQARAEVVRARADKVKARRVREQRA